MSNEEKKRLEEYKRKRSKMILIQSSVLVLLSIVCAVLFLIFHNINQTYYVAYTETSSIDYNVVLKENSIYDDDSLGEDYAYITSLISYIDTKFNYNLDIDAQNVKYNVTYKAEVMLKIVDKTTNAAVYKNVYIVVTCDNEIIYKKKKQICTPGEMENVLLKEKEVKILKNAKNITVELRKELE